MPQYLIWSHEHGAWWKPARWGYTEQLVKAGRFTVEEAQEICAKAAFGWHEGLPPEVMVKAPHSELVEVLTGRELDAIMRMVVDEVTKEAVAAKAARASECLDERMAGS